MGQTAPHQKLALVLLLLLPGTLQASSVVEATNGSDRELYLFYNVTTSTTSPYGTAAHFIQPGQTVDFEVADNATVYCYDMPAFSSFNFAVTEGNDYRVIYTHLGLFQGGSVGSNTIYGVVDERVSTSVRFRSGMQVGGIFFGSVLLIRLLRLARGRDVEL